MTRPLRINLAGGWYHVIARGNNRQAIYEDIANVVCIDVPLFAQDSLTPPPVAQFPQGMPRFRLGPSPCDYVRDTVQRTAAPTPRNKGWFSPEPPPLLGATMYPSGHRGCESNGVTGRVI